MPYGYKAPPPPPDTCFICNREIDFGDSYSFSVSWREVLPRGAARPSAWMWIHDTCAEEAAHPGYVISKAE